MAREPHLFAAHAARPGLRGSRRRDGIQEPAARHRCAPTVHGLPVPPRLTRSTASSGCPTAARCSTSSPSARERVKLMCHDIEDPTFDATAAATHPCMKMRPIHRPPRKPAGPLPGLPLGGLHRRRGRALRAAPQPRARSAQLEAGDGLHRSSRAQDAEPGGWHGLLGAHSIPASSSKTSRTAPSSS